MASDSTSNKYGHLDTLLPDASFTINGGSTLTKHPEVDLVIEDKNNVATLMCISNSVNCITWEKFDTHKKFVLAETKDPNNKSGMKTVYLTLKTNNDTVSNTISRQIEYKVTNPAITFNPNKETVAKLANITVTVNDSHLDATSLAYVWQSQSDISNVENNASKTSFQIDNNSRYTFIDYGVNNTEIVRYLCVYATDILYNHQTVCSKKYVIDRKKPVISFETNGSSTPKKSHSTKVTVSDTYLDETSLKYYWSLTNNTTTEMFNNASKLTNNSTITTESYFSNTYYLCVYASDIAGNSTTSCSNGFIVDNTKPVIAFGTNGNGNNVTKTGATTITVTDTNLVSNSTKYIWKTDNDASKVTKNNTTSFTNKNSVSSSSGLDGKYYVCAYAEDSAGNIATSCSNGFNLDNVAPKVVFATNGSTTVKKNASTVVTITDSHPNTNKYLWSTSSIGNAINGTSFNSKDNISSPSNLNGNYYLCIYSNDTLGNYVNTCSNVFKFDNTKPTITFSPNGSSTSSTSASSTITVSDTNIKASSLKYKWSTSSSASASDGDAFKSGESKSKSDVSGTYYLCAYAEDTAGNSVNKCSNGFVLIKEEVKPTLDLTITAGNAKNSLINAGSISSASCTTTGATITKFTMCDNSGRFHHKQNLTDTSNNTWNDCGNKTGSGITINSYYASGHINMVSASKNKCGGDSYCNYYVTVYCENSAGQSDTKTILYYVKTTN